MSPIFVRPVREQLEHDRLIRFLQAKYKRKNEATLNVGDEQAAPVKLGTGTYFPDIVLTDGKKLVGLVEVESGESVNNLEVMAQWVHFARARVPFHLYVPVQSYEVARRLCETYGARVSELWTYRPTHDGFDLVRMMHDPTAPGSSVVTATSVSKPAQKSPTPKAAARAGDKSKAGRKTPARRAATKASKVAVKKGAKSRAATPAAKPRKRAARAPAKTASRARKAVRKR